MKAVLVPLDGGKPFEIKKDLIVIGRQEGCDLVIDHRTVSKLHCVLARMDGLLMIRDLSSTNGCRVNGQRVTRGALLPNDVLAVAAASFRIHFGPDDPSKEKPADGRTEIISNQDAKDIRRVFKDPSASHSHLYG